MIVFKNYFKIVRGHLKAIGIYTVIFLAIIFFSNSSNDESIDYKKARADIYIEDLAKSDLSKAFIKYMEKENNIVDMTGKNIDDNLFYGKISTYIKIPEDFDKEKKLEIKNGISGKDRQYIKESINLYLDQIMTYEKAGFDKKEIIANTEEDFKESVKVSLNKDRGPVVSSKIHDFFNLLAYAFLSQIILVVSLISLTYKNKVIAMRNEVSPISSFRKNFELLMGHFVFALVSWVFYIIIFLIMYGRAALSTRVLLMIVNSMIFALSTVSLAIFITKLIKSENVMMAVMNVFALASSFLTGVFVPQEILSEKALMIGKVFPSFYYIANNDILASDFNMENFTRNISILIGYIIILFFLSLALDKILLRKKYR
ncbi:MAG: ABC transporter permease [Anaerococcus prevotii]|nr:ABC transporter permease [Anaerococcus prevotii]